MKAFTMLSLVFVVVAIARIAKAAEWIEIGEGFCQDIAGSSFNYLKSWKHCWGEEQVTDYDLDECKTFCEKMGRACVGIELTDKKQTEDNNGNNVEQCKLLVRHGVSEEEALSLVPNFCKYAHFNDFHRKPTIGGVVKSDGYEHEKFRIACWGHHRNCFDLGICERWAEQIRKCQDGKRWWLFQKECCKNLGVPSECAGLCWNWNN